MVSLLKDVSRIGQSTPLIHIWWNEMVWTVQNHVKLEIRSFAMKSYHMKLAMYILIFNLAKSGNIKYTKYIGIDQTLKTTSVYHAVSTHFLSLCLFCHSIS